jgi:hypothetical protein
MGEIAIITDHSGNIYRQVYIEEIAIITDHSGHIYRQVYKEGVAIIPDHSGYIYRKIIYKRNSNHSRSLMVHI